MSDSANTTIKQPPEYGSPYRYVISFTAFISQMALALCLGCLSPLGPYIREALNMNFTQFGLLFTLSNLGTAVMLWVTGPLVDRFGVRKILVVGTCLMGILLFVAGRLNTAAQLIALQLCLGICNSVAGPTGSKMITTWCPPKERGTMLGIKQAGIPATSFVAGFVLPLIATSAGWRGAYTAAAIFVLAVGIASGIVYKDSSVMKELNAKGSVKPSFKENLPMLINKDYILLCVGCLILMGTQFALSGNLSNYSTAVLEAQGIENAKVIAGRIYSISTGAGILGRVLFGFLAAKTSNRKTLIYSNLLATALLVVLALFGSELGKASLLIVMAVYGFAGFGWSGLLLAAAARFVPVKAAATAISVALSFSFFGMLIFSPVFGAVVDAAGFTAGWWFLAAATLVGVIILAFMKDDEVTAKDE